MLQKLKRRILVHRKWLIVLHVCSSMKHASLSRQTVALLPLCFCTFHQNLFCTKTCLVPFVKPFPPFKLKSVLYWYCSTEQISHVCAPPWSVSEEARRFVFVWRGIVAMKYVNQNKDCDRYIILAVQSMCFVPILFKITLYFQDFSRKKIEIWNFNSERFWSRVIHTNCRKWKQVIHYWQLGKNKPCQKSLQIQLKSCDFILNPV